jgi:hypothetical protein
VVGDGGGVLRLPRTHEQAKKVREWSGNAMVAVPLGNGHRSELRWARIAVAGDGRTRSRATVDDRMHGGALKMQELTVDLSIWSTTTIVEGGRHSFADSGEHLRQGKARFASLPASADAWLRPDHKLNRAHHLEHSKDSGVASSDG